MQYQAKVHIRLKESVLDPQGQAVTDALQDLGHAEVRQVRIGKFVEVWLEAPDEAAARKQVDDYCETLLANLVIETYTYQLSVADGVAGGA